MFHPVNSSILPVYLKTVLQFMAYESEDDLRGVTIDENFFNEMNSSIARILEMNCELSCKLRMELTKGGQDFQMFKLRSGHKNLLRKLNSKFIEKKFKRKDLAFWRCKVKTMATDMFEPSIIKIYPVMWENEQLCKIKCPIKTCKKELKLRKYYDSRNKSEKFPYALHLLKQHFLTHK